MTTKIVSFAGAAFLLSSIVQFVPVAQALSPALENNVASVSASQKVRCIMPPAQQKYCGL